MGKLITIIMTLCVAFGMSTLLITGVGIAAGVTNKHVIQPIVEWVQDPGPMFVDDPRCCR